MRNRTQKTVLPSSCVGIILAGGKSRRFGSPKAWARLEDTSFVERLYHLLNQIFKKTHVVLHEPSESFAALNPLLDLYPEGGPLNGIYSALVATQAPAIFVCACDLPLIRKQDIEYLLERWDPNLPALTYRHGKYWEPLCGFYNQKLARVIPKFLESGHYRLQDFLTQVGAVGVEYPFQDSLTNINTPEDYKKLKQKKLFL